TGSFKVRGALTRMASLSDEDKRRGVITISAGNHAQAGAWAARAAGLDALLAESGRTLVHPFDDTEVIAGQGTVGLEVLEDAPATDLVLVPVGGGGLVTGIAVAVKARPRSR